jgi:hypothetical protein
MSYIIYKSMKKLKKKSNEYGYQKLKLKIKEKYYRSPK